MPAICFLDLTGYTRLTEERGDSIAADLAQRLASMVERHSRRHGGTPVKWLGDGVMFHFPEPADGVLAALEMVEAAPDLGLPSAHVGLHAGPVLFQEGDYFGRTVNVAARIADYARPGEVVVSQEVVDAVADDKLEFSEIGPVELKGVTGPHRLYSARSHALENGRGASPGQFLQSYVGIHTCRRRDTLPGPIGTQGPGQIVVGQEDIEHLVDPELEIRIGDRNQGLDAAIEVPRHQVSRADVVMAGATPSAEAIDPGVLQVPADQ